MEDQAHFGTTCQGHFVNGSLALTCVPDLGKLALLGLGWVMSQMQGRHCPKSTSRLIIQMDGGIAGMKFC